MNRSLYYTWALYKKTNKQTNIINFGPQHPAAHGVLRLVLQLESETIQSLDIHIGLLHRGTEYLAETKYYEKSLPYFDRLDYVSMMAQEHTYCLAIESLLGILNVSYTTDLLRILFDEITRIMNHFLAVACHALDVGSMSSVFWAFEEREKLMEFYERVSGARMHAAFHRPAFTFNYNLDLNLLNDMLYFTKNCFVTLNEMHNVLTYNKIWKNRLINIGTISITDAQDYAYSGVMARSTGLCRDLRLSTTEVYSSYDTLNIKSYVGNNGDTYDRYLIRMLEMGESLSIMNEVIFTLLNKFNDKISTKNTDIIINKFLDTTLKNIKNYSSMEDLISHFITWHTGVTIPSAATSIYIESPKGEFGVNLISNNSSYPYKCKIRSPSYHHLQSLPKLVKGHYLADLATIIGTIDIVFGEIDR